MNKVTWISGWVMEHAANERRKEVRRKDLGHVEIGRGGGGRDQINVLGRSQFNFHSGEKASANKVTSSRGDRMFVSLSFCAVRWHLNFMDLNWI